METKIRVANPPDRPLLIFDGDCNFCRRWIETWRIEAQGQVDFEPSQAPGLQARFAEIPASAYDGSVQLVEPDGKVYAGAEAVFRVLAKAPGRAWVLKIYERLPGFAPISEVSYAFVARHRMLFSLMTKLLLPAAPPAHFLVRSVFLRLLGLVYFCAFGSLWLQVTGLVGENGILPASQLLNSAGQYFSGFERWHQLPTFCWWTASNSSLLWQCGLGTGLSLLLMIGFLPLVLTPILWLLFLSLTVAGQDFLGFQWENLLLESGLLAIFLAPASLTLRSTERPSLISIFLYRWLLFRLMFHSGVVKLMSGDPSWRDFTALFYHYETQPLPTVLGWHAYQLPSTFHVVSIGIMYFIELVVAFFAIGPRNIRIWSAIPFVLLQLGIALTGNYAYFNLLTILLCLLLLDDAALRRLFFRKSIQPPLAAPSALRNYFVLARGFGVTILGLVILVVTAVHLLGVLDVKRNWPKPVLSLYESLAPFRSINSYGLFAVMTKSRPEIIVEGSNDEKTWLAYEFKYKPGDLKRAPKWVAPHQPRLDWQMWFAALSNYQQNPWFLNFCLRLLQGTPEVLKLLEKNPFPEKPPKYIRAVTYDYEFATPKLRKETGQWWQRKYKEEYLPPVSLNKN